MSTPKQIPQGFTVPDTIEGVAGLLVARTWERAAIVYAWTQPEESGGRPKKSVHKSTLFNTTDFAQLGIAGLTTRNTVIAYRKAWAWAIDQGYAQEVKPGDAVDLPTGINFPPTTSAYTYPHELDAEYEARAIEVGVTKDAVRRTAANKAALVAAIKADPTAEQAAWGAIQDKQAEKAVTRRRDYGITCPPMVDDRRDSLEGSELAQNMDAAMDEAGRRDALHALLSLSQKVRDGVESLKAEHSHTGVRDEVELVHQISHNLSEAQWSLAEFIVEQVDQ